MKLYAIYHNYSYDEPSLDCIFVNKDRAEARLRYEASQEELYEESTTQAGQLHYSDEYMSMYIVELETEDEDPSGAIVPSEAT